MGLLACPFCREMFERGEATACPVCGMALTDFANLPPSHDAEEPGVAPTAPEMERLPIAYLGRGKGLLVVLAFAGIALFFVPWVNLTMPYIDAKSGFTLAHQRIGWLWAAFTAWFVLVPTVMSRRSVFHLRGARVAAAFLAAIPAVAVGILLSFPPHGSIVHVAFTWGWGLWGTLATSIASLVVAVRLGGGAIEAPRPRARGAAADAGRRDGQTVH